MRRFQPFCSRKWFRCILCMITTGAVIKLWIWDNKVEHTKRKLSALEYAYSKLQESRAVSVISTLSDCGINPPCALNTIPIHIYTGEHKNDHPKICIMGKYIRGKYENNYRGLNIVLLDPYGKRIKDMINFDTYAQDSIGVNIWLNRTVDKNDLILFYTHDEASNGLNENTRRLIIKQYGSGHIQNLQYRSQWYMITRKGIDGFTPHEQLNIVDEYSDWAPPINRKMCIS